MQSVSLEQLVGQNVGRYRIEYLLGRDRFNAIYLARHLTDGTPAALTMFLLPERFSPDTRQLFSTRFQREGSILKQLKHPNILAVYDVGEQFGYHYLITPYMTNGSLSDRLKQQGRMSPNAIPDILNQIVSGLEHAHSKGVFHGILKPANILLSDEKNWLVAGFGLLRLLRKKGVEGSNQPYSNIMNVADMLLVAPGYVAPEVIRGGSVNARSDIYALGCVLFELLSGKAPFSGANQMDVLRMQAEQDVPSLRTLCPDLPIALVSVLNQALERDPARRFERVSDLAEAFSQVIGISSPVQQEKSPTTDQLRKPLLLDETRATPPASSPVRLSETGANTPVNSQAKLVLAKPPVQEKPPAAREFASASTFPTTSPLGNGGANAVTNGDDARPWWLPEPIPVREVARDWAASGERRTSGSLRVNRQQRSPSNTRGRSQGKRVNLKDRRKVIALVASGGVAVAGALIAVNIGMGGKPNPGTAAQNVKGFAGNTTMPVNSFTAFTNAAGKQSLLIHLPNGNFVAYDRACTHKGVYLDYDPKTHLLICPAHDARFDPASNAKVVQGPAVLPQPPVPIQIKGDGTIISL